MCLWFLSNLLLSASKMTMEARTEMNTTWVYIQLEKISCLLLFGAWISSFNKMWLLNIQWKKNNVSYQR